MRDRLAREHEQAATSGADDESVSDNSYADDADEEEMLGQTSFFENNPYGVIMAKQTIYNAGIYVRLSQDDMRAGESLSIENQKLILVQLRTRTVSYKNHKVIKNDEEDMIVVKNTHEAIVSQELWDRVREMEQSVSQGKRNSDGYVANLSGLIYCQDCVNKVRLCWNNTRHQRGGPREFYRHNFNCTSYLKYGKRYCLSHYIKMKDMERIVLEDIRSLAQLVVEDEEKAMAEFLARKAKHHEEQYSVDTKKLTEGRYRLQELDTLIPSIYEDKVLGKVSEDVAMKLIAKYETEQKELSAEVADLEEKFSTIRQDEEDVALFMERLRKYTDVQELTRKMCLELIEYITLDAYVEGQPREIYIYYKLLDEPLKDKRSLF